MHFPLLLDTFLLIASPYSCLIVQVQSLHFLIMADPNPLYFISASEDGFFGTFNQLKEQKFGDTVRITEIKTPIVHYHVEKAINDDPASWDAFSKIFIAANKPTAFKNARATFISYIRSDGKPERDSLPSLFKVITFLSQLFHWRATCP